MADEDRKPRHRLGADELLEETQGAIAKIVNLLEVNGLAAESFERLTSLTKGGDFMGSLNLARRLGLSMPDVPHIDLVVLLLDAWDCVVYKTGHTRKQMYRKVRLLEADNKTEPDTLDRWKGERDKAERESAKANVAYVTMREIAKSFKDEPQEGGEGARVEQTDEVAP
ncbi:unnamed protein product [Ectocarpus sp. 13 AM-2016]